MTARCSTCSINYPHHFHRCKVCDGILDDINGDSPDDDWQETVERALAGEPTRPASNPDTVEAWRLEQLLLAGAALHDAERLARRHDIDLHQAITMLEHGCPSALAVEILD